MELLHILEVLGAARRTAGNGTAQITEATCGLFGTGFVVGDFVFFAGPSLYRRRFGCHGKTVSLSCFSLEDTLPSGLKEEGF